MFADAMHALYIILYIAPFSILRYYPFVNKLRISLPRLCGIYSTILIIEILVFLWLSKYDFWTIQLTQSYRSFFGIFYFVLSCIVIKENFSKHFFVYLLMFSYSAIVCRTAHMLEVLLTPHFVGIPAFFITNIAILLQLLVSFPFVLQFIKVKFTPLLETKHTDVWVYIWTIPMILIIFSFLFGVDLSKETVTDWKHYISRWVMSLGILFSCFILVKILEQTNHNATLNENIRMTKILFAAQNNHYKMLTDNIEKAKAARHDLHHHILVLQSYLHNKQLPLMQDYLNQYQVRLLDSTSPILCNNYIVDAILQHYKAIADPLQIRFTVKVDMPVQVAIDDLDLCIVLGNTMENAIEACQRVTNTGQFINLSIKIIGNMMVITIDNSYNGIVKSSATSLVSSKRSNDEEGIGLASIQSVVGKYNGVVNLDFTQDVFKTSMMLNLAK